MIWKPIQDYEAFKTVMAMPEGIRKRRTLMRLKNVNPISYDNYMSRWSEEHEPEPESEKPKKRGRRKQS